MSSSSSFISEVHALALPPLGVLLLLRGRTAGPQHSQHPTEKLSRRALDDGDHVSRKLGLLVVVDFLLLEEQQTLTLDFNVILFLVLFAQVARRARVVRA